MADFEKYYPLLAKSEGGYCSAEKAATFNDRGGETYLGIARNFNPDWEGWKIIDEWKAKNGEPKYNSFIPDDRLAPLAKAHSKKAYWDFFQADSIQNQSIAEAIVDFGFNSGVRKSAKAVQTILGLAADGSIGPKSLAAINSCDLQKLFNALQENRRSVINGSKLTDSVKQSVIARVNRLTFVP